MEIHIEMRLGTGGHRDLFLTIPQLGVEVCADSYYFAVALGHRNVRASENTVRQEVVALLSCWVDTVCSCSDGDTVYLPFDFSDQYTGCLRVIEDRDNFRLSYGHSLFEGWRIDPLEAAEHSQQYDDFNPSSEREVSLSKDDLLAALRGTDRMAET